METWRVKYQAAERGPWIELPLVGTTDDNAWEQFAAWRTVHAVDYHAAMVYRSA